MLREVRSARSACHASIYRSPVAACVAFRLSAAACCGSYGTS